MIRKAELYAKKCQMIEKGDKIVMGISGGADSVCLLMVLLEWKEKYGLELYAVHVNHGIRGVSADEDEQFVRELCEHKKVTLECFHENVPERVKLSGCTEEEEGRNLRYASFKEVCRIYGCNKIAVAHNRDDNAETVLFNLLRGSGISGIRGIAPVRKDMDISVIRPLLWTSRMEIEKYLMRINQGYRIDETNAEVEYSRNRIRNTVIPYIKKEINKGAIKHITELAAQAGELENFINELTEEQIRELEECDNLLYTKTAGSINQIQIEMEHLSKIKSVIRKNIIRKLVGILAGSLKDIESVHIDSVLCLLKNQTGKFVHLPYGITAARGYRYIILNRNSTCTDKKDRKKNDAGNAVMSDNIQCTVPGSYYIKHLDANLYLETKVYKKNDIIPKKRCTKWFDYDKIRNNLLIRSRAEGDYIGVNKKAAEAEEIRTGKKTLKSYFIDKKIGREERDQVQLLADGSSIMWIIGDRSSDEYLITDETKMILIAELRMNKKERCEEDE